MNYNELLKLEVGSEVKVKTLYGIFTGKVWNWNNSQIQVIDNDTNEAITIDLNESVKLEII